METKLDNISTAQNRANLYGFLAILFRKEPDISIVNILKDDSFMESLITLNYDLYNLLKNIPTQELFDKLYNEYTELFYNPANHFSPHESIYIDNENLLWGNSTVEVKNFIETYGFTYSEENNLIPDHISVELEFMQRVIIQESDNLSTSNCLDANKCLEVEKQFLENHIIKWIPRFCDDLIKQTQWDIYPKIAQLTKDFLQWDDQFLSDLNYN